jgi:hypothetical protein
MTLAVGLQPDQQPERRNDHVTVYEERFEPLTSVFALSAIVVGMESPRHCAKAGIPSIIGYEQSVRRVKLKLDGAVVAQIPAPARAGTRTEVASPETSHAESAL